MSKVDEYFDIIIKYAENLEDGTYCFIEAFDKSDRDWLDAYCKADNVCRRKLDIHASYDGDKICLKSNKPAKVVEEKETVVDWTPFVESVNDQAWGEVEDKGDE